MIRKLILALIALGTLALALVAYLDVPGLLSIRRRPARDSFLEAVNDGGPDGYLQRWFLLLPGAEIYEAATLPWLYSPDVSLVDNAVNRWILERHLRSIPTELAARHVQGYPLTPTSLVLERAITALQEGNLSALPLLEGSAEGRDALLQWIRNEVLARDEPELLEAALRVLVRSELQDRQSLLEQLLARLDPPEGSILVDRYRLTRLLRSSPAAHEVAGAFIAAYSAGALRPQTIAPIFAALSGVEQTSTIAQAFLVRAAKQADGNNLAFLMLTPNCLEDLNHGCSIAESFPSEVLQAAFQELKTEPKMILALFHGLLHSRHPYADSANEDFWVRGDSVVRKGMIVLRARHYHTLDPGDLDYAFRGAARRPLLFRSGWQYDQSPAIALYSQLSGHEYGVMGKRFPPYCGADFPRADDEEQWRLLIEDYPWLPAADDAYYRLAHLLYVLGDLDGAEDVVRRYERFDFIDDDIRPYMALLAQLLRATRRGLSKTSVLQITQEVGDLPWIPWRGWEAAQYLEFSTLAVDVLLAREELTSELELPRSFLIRLRGRLESARAACRESYFKEESCRPPLEVLRLRALVAREVQVTANLEGGELEAVLSLLGGP